MTLIELDPTDVSTGSPPVGALDTIERSLLRGDVVSALGLIRSMRRRATLTREEPDQTHPRLTEREVATLTLLADATLSQKDMARSLGITHNTLKTHLSSLYQKLGVHSRAEAIEVGYSLRPSWFDGGA